MQNSINGRFLSITVFIHKEFKVSTSKKKKEQLVPHCSDFWLFSSPCTRSNFYVLKKQTNKQKIPQQQTLFVSV